ncbi:MAG: addiction module antidote protein [Deltaproteobacteria bacterium]|nr:addiction module antidote protein [Deltaproteobacteria bacterium]
MKRSAKSPPSRNHEAATVESFRKDPQFAAEYLTAVFEDGDPEELLLAIHRVAKVCSGAAKDKRRP